jgi:hypothetical protein
MLDTLYFALLLKNINNDTLNTLGVKCYNDSSIRLWILSIIILGLLCLVFLGGVAKVISILVMVLRNAKQAFLALLLVMDLKPSHLVIALRNANKYFWRHGQGWT